MLGEKVVVLAKQCRKIQAASLSGSTISPGMVVWIILQTALNWVVTAGVWSSKFQL